MDQSENIVRNQIDFVLIKTQHKKFAKKPKAETSYDYWTISLMSHILKIFLRIMHTRIYKKCESQLSGTQFGFRNGVSTRKALHAINVHSKMPRYNCRHLCLFHRLSKGF